MSPPAYAIVTNADAVHPCSSVGSNTKGHAKRATQSEMIETSIRSFATARRSRPANASPSRPAPRNTYPRR
jgi:hypothetical protein